jgi:hypothetical protein
MTPIGYNLACWETISRGTGRSGSRLCVANEDSRLPTPAQPSPRAWAGVAFTSGGGRACVCVGSLRIRVRYSNSYKEGAQGSSRADSTYRGVLAAVYIGSQRALDRAYKTPSKRVSVVFVFQTADVPGLWTMLGKGTLENLDRPDRRESRPAEPSRQPRGINRAFVRPDDETVAFQIRRPVHLSWHHGALIEQLMFPCGPPNNVILVRSTRINPIQCCIQCPWPSGLRDQRSSLVAAPLVGLLSPVSLSARITAVAWEREGAETASRSGQGTAGIRFDWLGSFVSQSRHDG